MSEEREYILGARIDEPINQNDAFKSADPFNKSWTELNHILALIIILKEELIEL